MLGIGKHIPRYAIAAVFATMVIVGPIALQFASIFHHVGSVECCCGPHSADDDCGCPDCPANVVTQTTEHTQDHPGESEGSSFLPRMFPCASMGLELDVNEIPDWIQALAWAPVGPPGTLGVERSMAAPRSHIADLDAPPS